MTALRTLCATLLAIFSLQACAALPAAPDRSDGTFIDSTLERLTRIDHPPLNEMSGLLASTRFADTWWTLNDSGAVPALFALDADFRVQVPAWLAARYRHGAADDDRTPWPGIELSGADVIDWESLARIGDLIYVADTGNNGSARRDLGLWELVEPVPDATERVRPIRYLRVHYPEQTSFPGAVWEWDSEAVFSDGEILYLITKHRERGRVDRFVPGARLYRFDPRQAQTPSTPLQLVARQPDLLAATGADLSPDGRWLAVLTYTAVWLFPRPAAGDDWFAGRPLIRPLPLFRTRQAEAVAWENDRSLLIGNEDGVLFRMRFDAERLDPQAQSTDTR
ncbi:MAG TPA: hypothetical protein VLA56_10300 [Pseudomonadales bacterium]|nr:hypothetical protein [Pseudomonadales bacterium]